MKLDRTTKRIKCPKSPEDRCIVFFGFVTAFVLIVVVFLVLAFEGVFDGGCGSVEGRLCNGQGECINNVCICSNVYFSGPRCEQTLAAGYNAKSGTVCTNNQGYVGSKFATLDMISPACRETITTTFGRSKKTGGWGSRECIQDTYDRAQRVESNNGTVYDLFALPLCQCRGEFGGPDCSSNPCPQSVDFQTCSLKGNRSVSHTNNFTRSGLGCQCSKRIVNYLTSRTTLSSFSSDKLYSIRRSRELTNLLAIPVCGENLYSHPDDAGVMVVYSRPEVKTHSCFCQEGYYGLACEYGRCPEVDGKICGNNANPSFGFGAQLNSSVKFSSKAKTVCSQKGTVNCLDHEGKDDLCVNNTKVCELEFPLSCPLQRPVRCRDGDCVADPGRILKATNTFGLRENFTTMLEKTTCRSSLFEDPTKFLSPVEFQRILDGCSGDESTFNNQTGLMIPNGVMQMDSSLVVVMFETVSAVGSITLTYRGKTQQFVETAQNGSVQFMIWTETYEEEQRRLFVPLQLQRSVRQISLTEVDIWPSPFIYSGDPDDPIPAQWDKIRLTTLKDTFKVLLLDSSRTRIEFFPDDGEWFLANVTDDTYVIPGGKIVRLDDCMDEFRKCIWNSETSLSYDGTRKLCGIATSSTNLNCQRAAVGRRVSVVLTATGVEGEELNLVDWEGLSPWNIGPATLAVKDEDFSSDEDELLIQSSVDFEGVRAFGTVELDQIIVRSACPESEVNASVLNTRWFQEGSRRASLNLRPGMKAVGEASYFGMPKIVRGTVSAPNLLTVKGFDQGVRVSKTVQITSTEFASGVSHESFRVFPVMCPDGSPSRLKQQILPNIEVDCACTITGIERITDCMCSDEIEPDPYRCQCSLLGCKCNDKTGTGSRPGFRPLEQQLDSYRTGVQSICYFTGFTTSSQQQLDYLSQTVDSTGDVYIRRPENSDAIFLVEIRLEGFCGNGTVGVDASATVYSDTTEEIPTETMCLMINGTQFEVVKPLYDSTLSDSYDQWWITGLPPNVTVVPVFVPAGIPLVVGEVLTSSNQGDKDNVVSNSLTVWRSDALDVRPQVTLLFERKEICLGLFLVFDTVGIQADTLDSNEEFIVLPVEITVEVTTDGLTWTQIGTLSSDVYHGNQDYWFPFSFQVHYLGVRVSSLLGLAIRQILPMTNQRCDNTQVRLEADKGFRSIQSSVLEKILNRRINESLPCECTENCLIRGLAPLSTDSCQDEKFALERLGKVQYEMVLDRIETIQRQFYLIQNISANNVTGLFPSMDTLLINFTDEPLFKAWWLNDSLVPLRSQLNFSIDGGFKEGYFYYMIEDPLRERWTKIANSPEGFPRYEVRFNRSLLERGIVCKTGTQCGACGCSNRLDSIAPGLSCELTPFEQLVKDDYTERSNHTVKNSAVLDEYLSTGKVRVKIDSVKFVRSVTVLAKVGCGDCEGLIRCPSGECKTTQRDCPALRYDNPGDGCTRESTKNNKYRCVCKVGFGGSDCNIQYCTPIDPFVGKVNPHAACSCGQDPPICYQPGTMLYAPPKGYYTTAEVLTLNRGGIPRKSPRDVGWNRVHHSFSPFCVRFYRGYSYQGKIVRTNCPYVVIGPRGKKLTLDDCVKRRDNVTKEVLEWNSFSYGNGSSVTFDWSGSEAKWDMAPFRCPLSYSCEANPGECFNQEIIKPPCGRGGKCRADGTCDCFEGKETFVYTKEWTDLSKVPYNAKNPTEWLAGDKRWMFDKHCQAKNCTDGQCETIPYGCFPGTPSRLFRDRMVQCPLSSGTSAGMCAVDYQACDQGEVSSPPACYGNGIPTSLDYRNEVKCICGVLKTKLARLSDGGNVTQGRQSTELKKNGWGGDYCQDYICQDDPRQTRWVYEDPDTLEPFKDDEGYVLPGKYWGGSCGAPIGPDPKDLALWQQACPSDSRLARCKLVLCKIGGVPTAVPPEKCRGEERSIMSYKCNNKGEARADGTCDCQRDEEKGTGWAADYTREGCFKQVTCPLTWDGKPCNRLAETYDKWIYFPYSKYLEGQVFSWLLRKGLPATSKQVIDMAVPQPEKLKKLQESANIKEVLQFQADQITAQSSICLYPNDTSSNPYGMFPFLDFEASIGPYLKAFKFPHDVSNQLQGMHPVLTDRRYQQYNPLHSTPPQLNSEYRIIGEGESVIGFFPNETFVTHLRMFVYNPSLTLTAGFKISNQQGESICGLPFVTNILPPHGAADKQWQWVHVVCQQIWKEYDFTQLGNFYALACLGGTRSSQCTSWKDSVCGTIPGAQIQLASSIAEYAQCPKSARCCVPETTTDATVLAVRIETDSPVYVQEIVVMGYKTFAEEMTPEFAKEVRWRQNNITNFTPHGGDQCLDDLYLTSLIAQDGEMYLHQNYTAISYDPNIQREVTTHNFTTAQDACLSGGGHLVISSETAEETQYAKTFGETCCAFNPLKPLKCPNVCLVGAKNRDEMTNPLLLDFIHPAATANGCFIRMDGSIIPPSLSETGDRADFISCPKVNKTIYRERWFPSNETLIRPWEEVINNQYQEMMRQGEMVGARNPTDDLRQAFVGILRTYNLATGISYSADKIAWMQYGPFVLHSEIKYWSGPYKNAIGYFNGDLNFPNYYFPSRATLQTIPATPLSYFGPYLPRQPIPGTYGQFTYTPQVTKGATVKYWTGGKTCKVTVYSLRSCGTDPDKFFSFNGADQREPRGWKTTWLVTPFDDYQVIGQNLILHPAGPTYGTQGSYITSGGSGLMYTAASSWQECASPWETSEQNCRVDNQPSESRTFYNTDLRISSIQVEGDCIVKYKAQKQDLPAITRYFEEETQFYSSGKGSAATTHPEWTNGNPVVYGCALQCFMGEVCAQSRVRQCPLVTPYANCPDQIMTLCSAGSACEKIPYLVYSQDSSAYSSYQGSFDRGYWKHEIQNNPQFLAIYPKFDTYKVEVNFRAEGNPVNDGKADVCYLFWKTDPYMCMRVEVKVLDSFLANPTTDDIPAENTRTKDTRVDPTKQLLKVEPVLFRPSSSSSLQLLGSDIKEMLDQGYGLSFPLRFPTCANWGKDVRECPLCITPQQTGKWEFDPRKYFADKPQTFGEKVSHMRQSYNGTKLQEGMPVPEIQIKYETFTPLVTNRFFVPLSGLRYTETRFYGGLIAAFNLTQHRRDFELDNCVVVKATDRPSNIQVVRTEYTLDTAVCSSLQFRAVCVRDHTKFMIQRGRQCPPCGPSTRLGATPAPGVTVFDLYPTLDPVAFAPLHAKNKAYLEGRLIEYINVTDIDYDGLYLYVTTNTTDSIVAGIPEFREAMKNCYSDKPGRLSGGATVEDPIHWVDVCLTNIWPVDCGEVCSKETGLCGKRRAFERKWCDPDLLIDEEEKEIPDSDYPLGLLANTQEDPYNVSSCGVLIDPSTYWKTDAFGFPSISTKTFVILEDLPGQSVWLRITRQGRSTYQNTGKSAHKFIFRNTTRLWGNFECSRQPCNVTIWLSGLDPSYTTDPGSKIVVGSFLESPFFVDLAGKIDTYYRSLGWDIYGLETGDTIRLGAVIASNPETIAQCKTPKKWPIYQPKPWIEYATPINKCLFDYVQDPFTGQNLEPGMCQCDDPSYGGPTCEAPSIVSLLRNGKVVCGGFPSPGFMALDYQGNKVPVNKDGSWQSLDRTYWGCKTSNPGLIFRTVLFPQTRFDFQFIYLSHSITGQNQYINVPALTDDYDQDNDQDTTEDLDLIVSGAKKTCAVASASLPSWYTADEVAKFLALASGKTAFVDLIFKKDEYFKWNERATELKQCSVSEPCGSLMPVSPCGEDPVGGQCLAIQFNNLAYNQTGLSIGMDGSTSTGGITLLASQTLVVPLTATITGEGVTVKVYQNDPTKVFSVDVSSSPVGICTDSADLSIKECTQTTAISELTITAGPGGMVVKEVLVYKTSDTVRFWHFYS